MSIRSKNSLRAFLGAALALWLPIALAGEITLYQQRDFRGESLTLNRAAPDLERSGFNDSASSIVVRSGVWEACTAAFFQGTCVRLEPGDYRRLESSVNNRVTSVREIISASGIPPALTVAVAEPRIALFERPGFAGEAIELSKTNGKLDRLPSYSGAQAVIVYSGTWRLCSREYYRGDCRDFSPGRYDLPGPFGSRVNSAELVATVPAPVGVVTPPGASGLVVTSPGPVDIAPPPATPGRVVLYELPQFGGRSLVIDRREAPNLEWLGFENRAASMRIEEGYWMFCTNMRFRGECRTLGPGEYPWLPRDLDRRITSAQRVYAVYGATPAATYSLR
jgi:hypothetical protein